MNIKRSNFLNISWSILQIKLLKSARQNCLWKQEALGTLVLRASIWRIPCITNFVLLPMRPHVCCNKRLDGASAEKKPQRVAFVWKVLSGGPWCLQPLCIPCWIVVTSQFPPALPRPKLHRCTTFHHHTSPITFNTACQNPSGKWKFMQSRKGRYGKGKPPLRTINNVAELRVITCELDCDHGACEPNRGAGTAPQVPFKIRGSLFPAGPIK